MYEKNRNAKNLNKERAKESKKVVNTLKITKVMKNVTFLKSLKKLMLRFKKTQV